MKRKTPTIKERTLAMKEQMKGEAQPAVTLEVLEAKGVVKTSGALSEEHIRSVVAAYERSKKYPLKLACNVCGTEKFAYNGMADRIKEHGTFELAVRRFKCRNCGKEIKQTVKEVVKKIKEEKKQEEDPRSWGRVAMPNTPNKPIDFTRAEDVAEYTKDICAKPHIYLNGNKYCDACPLEKLCVCPMKRVRGKR